MTMSETPPPDYRSQVDPSLGRLLILLAAFVFIVTVGALVALVMAGKPTDTVESIAGPVVASLFLGGVFTSLTAGQNRTLRQIERQTNGILDGRIRTQGKAATLEALQEVGLLPSTAVVVEPATPADAGVTGPDASSASTLPPGFVEATLVHRVDPQEAHSG